MAVYERTYRPYAGVLTPERTRFLIVPRYALAEVFGSRLFTAFFVTCFIWPLLLAVLMYLSYNLAFLKLLTNGGTTPPEGTAFALRFDGPFFMNAFMLPQFWMSFFLAFLVGPQLISADLRNNALPLYLSRPFSRGEYILGKIAVLFFLLSAITWIPGLALFGLHAYLAGGAWLTLHGDIGLAILLGSWVSIGALTLVSLALSAYVKWKPVARLGLFAVFIVAFGFAGVIGGILDTPWGALGSMGHLLLVIWASLFGTDPWIELPPWAAWIAMATLCTLFFALLWRRVRAYEVVR
jgi:ABC-type transport system involved in multi-copper enzyme maturation permease subunit